MKTTVVNRNQKGGNFIEPLNSAENVLNILFIWNKTGKKELGLTEISRAAEINKSTVYKILISLQKHHLVSLDPGTKKYSIDYGVLELSKIFLKQSDLRTVAHPWIERLAEESGRTITMALRKEKNLVFIDRVDGSENVRFYCDIGKVAYYNSGAAAKAVFANLPEKQQQNIVFEQDAHRFTPHTKTWEELMLEVPQIREKGYSVSDEEVDEGVFAVGAPIFDAQGQVAAGIAMAALKFTLSAASCQKMAAQLVKTAQLISEKLGYPGT